MLSASDPLRGLPAPGAEAEAHGQRVVEHVREAIARAGGRISFERYMALALYAPGLGYYAAGLEKLGALGDFVTAPEIGPAFARTLARALDPLLAAIGSRELVEVGAGSGALAAALVAALAARGAPVRYRILEPSAALAARQRERLAGPLGSREAGVEWLGDLPPPGFRGVIVGNELLDALPVRRFRVGREGFEELFVAWQDERFAWRFGEPEPPLAEALAELERGLPWRLPDGYVSEVGLAARAWVREALSRIERGVLLLFDYGYPRGEYYHPDRAQGTLRCHYRHRAHDDPLVLTGLQDLSACVDFTAVAEAAREAGGEVAGYTTQALFLLGAGLAELAEGLEPGTREHASLTGEIKRLILPGEMGELVKVIALARGFDGRPPGFALRDLGDRL